MLSFFGGLVALLLSCFPCSRAVVVNVFDNSTAQHIGREKLQQDQAALIGSAREATVRACASQRRLMQCVSISMASLTTRKNASHFDHKGLLLFVLLLCSRRMGI